MHVEILYIREIAPIGTGLYLANKVIEWDWRIWGEKIMCRAYSIYLPTGNLNKYLFGKNQIR